MRKFGTTDKANEVSIGISKTSRLSERRNNTENKRLWISVNFTTQYESDELKAILPATVKSFSIIEDKFIDLSRESDISKDELGQIEDNCSKETRAKQLKI